MFSIKSIFKFKTMGKKSDDAEYNESENTGIRKQIKDSRKKHNALCSEYDKKETTPARKKEIEQIWRDEEEKRIALREQLQ